MRNNRHLKINNWASIVFILLGLLPHNRQVHRNNWEELEWIWQTHAICWSQTPRSFQGCVGTTQRQDCWGRVHKKEAGGPLRGPSNAALFPRACFVHLCFTDCEWQLEWAQIIFPLLVPLSKFFLLWLPGLGPGNWLILWALGNLPSSGSGLYSLPASPNRPPHWRALEAMPSFLQLHRVW